MKRESWILKHDGDSEPKDMYSYSLTQRGRKHESDSESDDDDSEFRSDVRKNKMEVRENWILSHDKDSEPTEKGNVFAQRLNAADMLDFNALKAEKLGLSNDGDTQPVERANILTRR